MQLTPVTTAATAVRQPSKTWKIDFEKKKITGTIDGLDALRQAVFLCLNAQRYEHVIYSWNYGVETKNLAGGNYDLVRRQLQSAIEDALSVDSRISGISDFHATQSGDSMTAMFTVTSNDGTVIMEVNTNV